MTSPIGSSNIASSASLLTPLSGARNANSALGDGSTGNAADDFRAQQDTVRPTTPVGGPLGHNVDTTA